jgi:hypothetical protein
VPPLKDIYDFASSVLTSLPGYITGGVIVAIITVWERWKGRQIPWRHYKWALIAFVVVGCFTAWHSEREKAQMIPGLKDELANHVNNVHLDDPAYQHLASLVASFERLKQVGNHGCAVFVTDPRGHATSVFETINLAAGMAVCEVGFNSGLDSSPESLEIGMRGYIDDKVVIHAPKDDPYASKLEDDFSQLFFTSQSRELLKQLPDRAIWIQVGKNVQWNR